MFFGMFVVSIQRLVSENARIMMIPIIKHFTLLYEIGKHDEFTFKKFDDHLYQYHCFIQSITLHANCRRTKENLRVKNQS